MTMLLKADKALTSPLANNPVFPPPPITSDTFSGANAASVEGRMTDARLGGSTMPWIHGVDKWGNPPSLTKIEGGRLVHAAQAAESYFFVGFEPTSADYRMSFVPLAGSSYNCDVRRTATDPFSSPSGYRLSIVGNACSIVRRIGTANLNLTASFPFQYGQRIGIQCKGTAISLYIDDVLKASGTDDQLPGKGFTGFAGVGTAVFTLDDVILSEAA